MLQLLKSTTALRALIISSCIFTLIFVSGFNFENFTQGSHSYYASEITCSSPSKDLNCSQIWQIDQMLFRGHLDEPTQITDYGSRYISSSFAKFIGIFISSTDSFRMVILKTYLIKALLATYLLFSILICVKKFKDLRSIIAQLSCLFFSAEYFLRAITSVYPTGLATVAFLSSLVILKIFMDDYAISKNMKIFLSLNFSISSLLIVSNRFETTCYMLLCFFVFIVFGTKKTKFFERLKLASTPILVFATSFAIIWITSTDFRKLLKQVLRGDFQVLTIGMIENSEIIQKFGRAAVAAEAPLTLITNTYSKANYGPVTAFFKEHFDFAGSYIVVILQYILITSFFVPGLFIFFNALIKNLRPFFDYEKFDRSERKSQMGSLFIIFNMFLIPFLAFTPWFIWYIMPLLLTYVLFADASLNSRKVWKYLYLTVFLTNSFSFYLYNDAFNGIYISGFMVRPLVLKMVFIVAALTIWFQVPRFVNSDQQK